VPLADLQRAPSCEPSAAIRARVVRARRLQAERYRDMPGILTNADVRSRDLPDVCRLDSAAQDELRRNLERLSLSARAYDRVLRVARTIADLRGGDGVTEADIMEAAGYRQLDDKSGFLA